MICRNPSVILYDSAGNAIDSMVDDDSNRRLQVETIPKEGTGGGGGPIQADPALWREGYCLNGSSSDLTVNGSGTPVDFTFDADATYDTRINEIRFILEVGDLKLGGEYFGEKDDLSNGVLIDVDVGGGVVELGNFKTNENLMEFSNSIPFFLQRDGNIDILSSVKTVAGALTLRAGTSDRVRVRIRDNLTDSSYEYFICRVYGMKV